MKTITNTNFIKITLFFTFLSCSYLVTAQEEEKETTKFSISGTVDAYYRANLNSANS